MIARLFLLVLLLGAALTVNLCLGSVALEPQQVLNALCHPSDSTSSSIIWQIRMPRMLCALCVGTALGVSGYLLQGLSRNYLADPYLTGVSSGSALFFAAAMLFDLPFAAAPAVALCGGLSASLLVASLARTASGLSVTRLLLAGVAVSAVCGGLITLLMTSSVHSGKMQSLLYFLAGSISGKGWAELSSAILYLAGALIASVLLSKQLRILSIGSESAASLGVNLPRMQSAILFVAVVLCAVSVSLGGIVGFVGLTAPYLSRICFGSDERVQIPAAALLGAVLVLISDLVARTAGGGQELPLNTLLSLIGAPFFLWLITKQREEL